MTPYHGSALYGSHRGLTGVGSITAAQMAMPPQELRQRTAGARLALNSHHLITRGTEIYRGVPLDKSFKDELQDDIDNWLSDVKL